MASGLPVVARIDESVTGLLKNRYNARLFHQCEEIPDILDELFEDKEALSRYSKNALTSVQEYSAVTFAERVFHAYTSTIDRLRVDREARRPVPLRLPVSAALRKVKLVMTRPSRFRKGNHK